MGRLRAPNLAHVANAWARGDGAALLLVCLACAGPACRPAQQPAPAPAVRCAVDAGACRATLPGALSVSFELSPKPVRTLADLSVLVDARAGGQPIGDAAVAVELRMPGMFMGVNRVTLAPRGAGRYEGRLAIVRCPSGRREWEATLLSPSIPGARFLFEVDRP